MMDKNEILTGQVAHVRKMLFDSGESLSDEEAGKIIEDYLFENDYGLTLPEFKERVRKIYARTRSKLGILALYLEKEGVNEIMINGRENLFFEDEKGISHRKNELASTDELEEIIRNIAAGVHREINEMHPILDARLADGSRVNAVYRNVAVNGPALTIRRFAKNRITIDQMIGGKTLSAECGSFLKLMVECRYNIFVSGGTSSGKTTFLNALSDFIPKDERVIVIEDSTELQLQGIENLVQMECRNANSLGQGEVSMDMLIKTSLRMRPDRIIVGEVRGKEVSDMLQAMNTGHDGSMSTGHGNSVSGMLRRLESMYLMSAKIPLDAIRAQIVEGIEIMVHLGRFGNGERKVMEIQELCDYEGNKYVLNPLFYLDSDGMLKYTGNRLKRRNKLILKGYDGCGL